MRIEESLYANHWSEHDLEPAEPALPPPPTPAEGPAPVAPAEPVPLPFWAEGEPLQPSLLQQLPAADVAFIGPVAPGDTAALPAAPPVAAAPAPYVGEPAVSPQWLATREAALVAVRHDFQAAQAQAQAQVGGPGWVPAQMVSDESGQMVSAYGQVVVFVVDPHAAPVQTGWDEGGPVYAPAGQWLAFDEAAFAAHYRAQGSAQGGTPLQALAACYDTDAATLLARHPDLWTLATSDHALNAGPAPAGQAMGDPAQLGLLDLYLADPQVADLVQRFGGHVPPASSAIAQEQVRVYGQERYEQLTRLGNAMASVRQQYSDTMAWAHQHGGAGWTERPRTVTTTDESGASTTQPLFITDESGQPLRDEHGQPLVATERVFDPDAFTDWYLQQGGPQHQAFASFYGRSHTQFSTDESGQRFASAIGFDNASWQMMGVGDTLRHQDLVSLDPNHAPRLNNDGAVGFDLEAGWATHHSNIHQKRDWFETIVQVAIVAAVSYVTAGAASGWAAASWGATAGAVAGGVAAGAAGAFVSGAMNGNLAFKDILRGALAGGLSGGLLAEFGAAAASYGPGGTIALRTTVQGGIQALLGGSFKDGALAGFASGLAEVTSAGLNANINQALAKGTMDAGQAAAARMLTRVLGSAIRVAGTPGDPGAAFASSFLSDLLREADPAGFYTQPVQVGPGAAAATTAPASQQFSALRDQLMAQGLDAEQASTQALQQLAQAGVDTRTARGYFVPDEHHDAALAKVKADWAPLGPADEPDTPDAPVGPEAPTDVDPAWPSVTLPTVVVTGQRASFAGDVAKAVGGTLDNLFQEGKALAGQALQWAADGLSVFDVPVLQDYQARVRDYLDQKAAAGGLSEAEIVVFGALYAANEALFPTSALDFTGGMGKAIGAAAVVLRTSNKVDDVADVVRAESRALAQSTEARVAEVTQRAREEGLQVVTARNGSKGDWNADLNGQFKPNTVYLLDNGHAYTTDTFGRVVKADGVLDVGKADRNTWQQAAAGHVGGEGYDGGHLIASLFGGAGERINLVPQLSSVNRGEFREMERQWAQAVLDGKAVRVEVSPVYSGTSGVPDLISVRYWVDGKLSDATFPNTKGG